MGRQAMTPTTPTTSTPTSTPTTSTPTTPTPTPTRTADQEDTPMPAQSHSRRAQRAADRQAIADRDYPPVVRPRRVLALAGAAATIADSELTAVPSRLVWQLPIGGAA